MSGNQTSGRGRVRLLAAAAAALLLAVGAQAAKAQDATALAYGEIKAGKYQDAIAHLRARVKAAPRDGKAVFLLGVAHSRLGEFKIAAQDFAAYVKAGGKNPETPYEYGIALLWSRGDIAEATRMLESYRQAHPQSAKASLALGQAYLLQRRFDAAEAAFKETLDRPESRAAALFWLGVLETARKDDPAAKRYLQDLLAAAPDSPEVAVLKQAAERAKSRGSQPQQ